jgi:hypothetical protein
MAKIWDVEKGICTATFDHEPRQTGWLAINYTRAVFVADGQNVIATGLRQHPKFWETATGKLLASLPAKPKDEYEFDDPEPLILHRDGSLMIVYLREGVSFLDAATGELRYRLKDMGRVFTFVEPRLDGFIHRFAVGSEALKAPQRFFKRLLSSGDISPGGKTNAAQTALC